MGGDGGELHRVRQGETTESLAASRRIFWRDVWDHPRNAALREKRPHQNLLHAGDELFLPDIVPRSEDRECTRRHTFRLRGIPTHLRVRYLDLEGNPRAGEPFHLRGDGVELRGNLDGEGWLRVDIHPRLARVLLSVGEPGSPRHEEHVLLLGHLDPVEELSGVCDRLHNLGYYEGDRSAPADDEELMWAVLRFRRDEELGESTDIDDALRAALIERHGG
jgi:hypothetical protein